MSDHLNERGYARCKACDRRFYPKWHQDRKQFEDMCWQCLPISIAAARTDSVLFPVDAEGDATTFNPDGWEQNDDQAFIAGYMLDKVGLDSGDLWKEDEYLEHGENAFGDLGYFDSYEG